MSPLASADANRLAFRVAGKILDACHDFHVSVEGMQIAVNATRGPAMPWPKISSLVEASDGPWPASVHVHCAWKSGSVDLTLRVAYWQATNQYRHLIGLKVEVSGTQRDLVWITIPLALMDAEGDNVVVFASAKECKHSSAKDYLIGGYREAMLYRHEYLPVLRGAVKAALVTSGNVPGGVRSTDEVIAVDWHRWPPREVIASVLEALSFDHPRRTIPTLARAASDGLLAVAALADAIARVETTPIP